MQMIYNGEGNIVTPVVIHDGTEINSIVQNHFSEKLHFVPNDKMEVDPIAVGGVIGLISE